MPKRGRKHLSEKLVFEIELQHEKCKSLICTRLQDLLYSPPTNQDRRKLGRLGVTYLSGRLPFILWISGAVSNEITQSRRLPISGRSLLLRRKLKMSRYPSPQQEQQLRERIARYEQREKRYPTYDGLWKFIRKVTTVHNVRVKLIRKYMNGWPEEEPEVTTDASPPSVDVTALLGEMEMLVQRIKEALRVRVDRTQ